jgi:peptidoglycan/LPS O-acetylase OafA/YrhL
LSSIASARTDRIYPLTSLRFFAALYVAVQHTLGTFVPRLGDDASFAHSFPWRLIFVPDCAVSFFFLLSGYVLSLAYLREGKRMDRRSFFWSRFARIYPLFLATLILDTPHLLWLRLATGGWMDALGRIAVKFGAHLVLLQAWYPRFLGIDGPNWSISDEAFFYLCFPVLGALLWKLKGATLWGVAAGLYVGVLTAVWVVRPHVQVDVINCLPLFNLPTFALGILLARWQWLRQRTDVRPVRAWQANAVFVTAVACLVIILQSSWMAPWGYMFFSGLLVPIFAAIIWAVSSTSTAISRFLSRRWLVALGEGSFALYLIHLPIFHLFRSFQWVRYKAAYPIYLTVCVGLSLLSFFYFETPVRAWLLEKVHSRSVETVETASIAQ